MLSVYVIGRAILRVVFSPRSLPLWWPNEIGLIMVVGLIVIAALYVAAIAAAARWLFRAARRSAFRPG